MTYVIGAAAGLVLGAIIGALKIRFIWGEYLRKEYGYDEAGALYGRMLASNITNVAVLVIVFFLRDIVPFDGISFLIGTAVALVLMNKALSISQKKNNNK